MKDIRRALVDADVNYKTAKEFTEKVKNEALGQKVLTAVAPDQLLVKVMNDELTAPMGGTASDIKLDGNPIRRVNFGFAGLGKNHFG